MKFQYTFCKLLFLCLLFSSSLVYSQDINQIKLKYPGHNEMVIKDMQSYVISVKKNKPVIIQDNYNESIILSDKGIHNNTESFTFSELVPLKSYDAYTLINKNGKEKKIPIGQVSDKANQDNSIFFSDVKRKKLTFENLEVGAKKIYSFESEILDPHLMHSFVFANYLPMEEAKLEIVTDNEVEIGYKVFNDPKNEITFTKKEKRGKTTYSWSRKDCGAIKLEDNQPGFLHIAPHLVFYLKSYKGESADIQVLGNTDLLYKYYQGFIENINKEEDEGLKKTAISLTENKASNSDKIKAIYYWVKDNIKYVAFENGYEGFIPRDASLVYKRRFGDCKDMSSIIVEMAKYADIPKVGLCWIGTRRLPYSYHELSTPSVDDHMIAAIDLDGKTFFLDATDSKTAFGLPSSFIQGKEALIQNGETYKIVEVPVVAPITNLRDESIKLSIKEKSIEGSSHLELNGLSRSTYLNQLGDATDKAKLESIKNLVSKGNNKFILRSYTDQNIENRDSPYAVDYSFQIDNYMITAAGNNYLSLFLEKPFEDNILQQDRVSQYEFDNLTKYKYSIELAIPDNKISEKLPENHTLENDLMAYKIEYILEEKAIKLKFEIENKKLLINPSDFDLWNKTIKDLKSIYSSNITLHNKS